MLKEKLYRLLGFGASVCFHSLNLLLKGNLPPFGSVCVVIKEGNRYLLLERSTGRFSLPGGFMRWSEDPAEAARRECREETGLEMRVKDLTGCFSCPATSWDRMSTVTMVYSGEVAGGRLRQALEGRPGWFLVEEVRQHLDSHQWDFFSGYLEYYNHRHLPASSSGE